MLNNFAPELVWFLLGLCLMFGELAIPAFILLFFGLGAWITSLCILLGVAPGTNTQLIIFLLTSVLSLVLFRKKGKELARGRISRKVQDVREIDDVKGGFGIVVEAIDPNILIGKVEFHGTNWMAVADAPIAKGVRVAILGQDNLTLRVKAIN